MKTKCKKKKQSAKRRQKNVLNSQNGKRPLTVNGQYCKQLLLLCLRLLPLIPLLFLSFSNRSRESKGICAYRDNSGADTHTGGHSHGLTHTHAHLQALQVRFAYRDNSAVQCSSYTLADRDALTFSRSHACTLAHKLSRFWEHRSLCCCCCCCNSQCNVAAAQSKKILQILQKYSWHAFDLNNNN